MKNDFYSDTDCIIVSGNKYPVDGSFRCWIKVMRILNDPDIPPSVAADLMISLVSHKMYSDISTGAVGFYDCIDAIASYMNPFRTDRFSEHKAHKKPAYDLLLDSDVIYASFMAVYHIDLSDTDLSWRHFMALLRNLPEDCAFMRLVTLRETDERHIKDDRTRHRLRRFKRMHSLESKKKLASQSDSGGDCNGGR